MDMAQTADEPETGTAEAPAPKILRCRGLRFPNDPRIISPRTRKLLRTNQYEMREAAAVRALVGPEDVAMELGGGIGFMSTLMARSCKAKAVHSFEANPSLIPYIARVHEENGVTGHVEVTNAVLGARKGKAKFYERAHFSASSLEEDPPGVASPVVAVHEVEVLNIKTVMKKIKPSVVVCDIEGAEADLVPLMDLSTVRLGVVELHPQWIGKEGVQAVFDAFHRAGLTFYPKTSNKKVVTFRRDW
jgi:FkbM family methyltransferase